MNAKFPNVSSPQPLTNQQPKALDPPAFDSFPYLVTLVVSRLYHLALLSGSFKPEFLRRIAQWQALANKLQACLVLDEEDCYYYSHDGTERRSTLIPRI